MDMGPRVSKNVAKSEGQYLAVVRPANPQKALDRIEQIKADQDSGVLSPLLASHQFNQMLTEQPYQFLGALSSNGKHILDPDTGVFLQHVQPGDSFVGWIDLQSFVKIK